MTAQKKQDKKDKESPTQSKPLAQLDAKIHTFRTACDTEVIVHAYEAWGEGCVGRFRGMFAFAVWDAAARRLFLARDRMGQKPLVYAHQPGGGIVFAPGGILSTGGSVLQRDDR